MRRRMLTSETWQEENKKIYSKTVFDCLGSAILSKGYYNCSQLTQHPCHLQLWATDLEDSSRSELQL